MEVNEVLVRLLRGHRRLLLVCLIVPTIVVCGLAVLTPVSFSSSARLQATSTSPSSDTEADAVLNRVKGIATSPAVVAQALHDADLAARSVPTMEQEVDVTRLGSSAVFDLTVTDENPTVAAKLAATLTTATISFLNGVGGPSSKLLNDLTDHQSQLLAQRQPLAARLALVNDPVTTANLSAQVAGIDQQLNQVGSSLAQLQYNGASGASAVLISQAGPAVPAGSKLTTDVGLALVLGLALGLMTASVLEVVRPRVAHGRAYSREMGIPFLGRLPRRSATVMESASFDAETALAVREAASRATVDTVVVVGPAGSDRLAELAAALDTETGGVATVDGRPTRGGRSSAERPALVGVRLNGTPPADKGAVQVLPETRAMGDGATEQPLSRDGLSVTTLDKLDESAGLGRRSAMVAVIPDLAPYPEVRRIEDLASATGWPVLGVIADATLGPPRWPRSSPASMWRRLRGVRR